MAHFSRQTAASRPQPTDRQVTRVVELPCPFSMRRGGQLPEAHIAYETWGELTADRDNAVLLFTGLSPDAHAASSPEDPRQGWWEFMVGPGKPIDTRRYFVICINSLGSCYGSTGPASINPETRTRYNLNFPDLTIEDIATGAHAALRELGIDHLHSVVGASLGGMAALAYAILFPDEVDSLVSVSAAAYSRPFAIAIRSLQREMIRSDPAWSGGEYAPDKEPYTGMALARKLGVISYRSSKEWDHRFGRERVDDSEQFDAPFGIEFQVESYLEHHARKFVGNFDANCYLYLSRAMDWFHVADHGDGSTEAGLAKIRARRCLVVGVESDFLFPVDQQRELVAGLQKQGKDVRFAVLPSVQGHDAFLVDEAGFAPVLRDFFLA